MWRRVWDSNPRAQRANGFQDRLVMTASIPLRIWNCLSTEIIRYSIVLEILLEMRFCAAFGVPEKSVFTRLFCVFATAVLANFQDHLVMTASITLRVSNWPKSQQIPKYEIKKIARKLRDAHLAKCKNKCEKPNKIKGFGEFDVIRTIVFQDRLVMTASITLRVCYLIVFFLAFRILDRDHFGQVFYRLKNGVFWTSFGVLHLASSRGCQTFRVANARRTFEVIS